jgi:hypothetical protein
MWAIKLARDEMIRQVQELEAQMLHEHVKEVGNQVSACLSYSWLWEGEYDYLLNSECGGRENQ